MGRTLPIREPGRGVPEIACDEASEPVEVALGGRAVEPHAGAQLGELLRSRIPAEHGTGSIAGQDLRSREDEDRDDDEGQDAGGDAANDEAQDRMRSPPARVDGSGKLGGI
jgi:hypothetical protein